jgi:hypothetical protein
MGYFKCFTGNILQEKEGTTQEGNRIVYFVRPQNTYTDGRLLSQVLYLLSVNRVGL